MSVIVPCTGTASTVKHPPHLRTQSPTHAQLQLMAVVPTAKRQQQDLTRQAVPNILLALQGKTNTVQCLEPYVSLKCVDCTMGSFYGLNTK